MGWILLFFVACAVQVGAMALGAWAAECEFKEQHEPHIKARERLVIMQLEAARKKEGEA